MPFCGARQAFRSTSVGMRAFPASIVRLRLLGTVAFALGMAACDPAAPKGPTLASYFAPSEPGPQAGGVKMVPIKTPKGDFKVWTKRFGSNPRIKLLLLHGGPAATHEYFEALETPLAAHGIEFIY